MTFTTSVYPGPSTPTPVRLSRTLCIGAGLAFNCQGNHDIVLILLALIIVLLLFGLGFAAHLIWIAAVIFFIFWLVGLAIGRGESSGRHRFYRW